MEKLVNYTTTLNEVTINLEKQGLNTDLSVKGILKEAGEKLEDIDDNYSYKFNIQIFKTIKNYEWKQ